MRLDHSAVLQLAARNIGAQNIAIMLGGSMEDVRRILKPDETPANDRAPAALPAKAPTRDERFRAMWEAGVPNGEIMAALGLGRQNVSNIRDRLGLKKRVTGRPIGRGDRKVRG